MIDLRTTVSARRYPALTFALGVLASIAIPTTAQYRESPAQPRASAGASTSWMAEAQENIRRKEYEATWQGESGVGGSSWQAPNRANNLRTSFTDEGIVVVPRTGSEPAWSWGLRLRGVAAAQATARGNRVEYVRGDVTEWYVNEERGLEQGFTIARPVPGLVDHDGRLRLSLEITGNTTARGAGQGAIEFQMQDGRTALRYDKLVVRDGEGRTLPSSMDLQGTTIVLRAEVGGASWPVVVDPLITSTADAQLESNQVSARFGISVSGAGDVNGDGYGDVIVGAYFYDNGQNDEGAAFVYHGSAGGVDATADAQLESNQVSAQFGISVSGAGDVNGDGYGDVIVGADFYDNGQSDEGAAFVYHGSAGGVDATADAQLESNQGSAHFGISVSGAGDVNGDGYGDVVVGAYFYDNGEIFEGAAFVYHGSAGGVDATSDAQLESNQVNAQFGRSVSGAGDVNGDGYGDVIVGANFYDNGQSDEGAAFVYHGSAGGVDATADAQLEANQASARFGYSVSGAGDVNGDGYGDVIVGAREYSNGQAREGAAFVYHGSAGGVDATADAQLESNQVVARLGISVSGAGDVNGDGYGDVVVGAFVYANGQLGEGAAFVYHGSAGGVDATADAQLESNQVNAHFGTSVSGAGDVNGDGYGDVIVGAADYDNGQSEEGAAFVYQGSAGGVDATADVQVESNQADAQFGVSVSGAGDVNGDGYGDVVIGAPFYDNGQGDEGAAFVYHGSASGVDSTADAQLESNQVDAQFGVSVSGAGDVNGDGYGDVIVGAYVYDNGQNDEGAAFVYHGSAGGVDATADAQLESNQVSAQFGTSVSGAGDVNGDGYGDVVVGAPYYDNGQTNEGAAFVYHGSAGGVDATAGALLESNQDTALFGSSVSGADDANGDGYGDVVVGTPLYDNGQTDEGAAFVYHGSASGVDATADAQLESNDADAQFGISLSGAGDVDGDGYGDVIVGAFRYDNGQSEEGAAFVYHGSAGGVDATADAQLESNQVDAFFGISVSEAGDVNGDGYGDVIVGAHVYDNGQNDEGATFVYHGSAGGVDATADAQLESNQVSAQFGFSVSGAGDVNGDGYGDVIVGARHYANGESQEGAAFVYLGNTAGRPVQSQQLRGDGSMVVEEWGISHSGTAFVVAATANSPRGRERARLQAEACPSGTNFGAGACTTVTAATWTDLGTDGRERLQLAVTGLTANVLYHWRARVLYAPLTVTATGIIAPPAPEHGPWRRLHASHDNYDIRVSLPQTINVTMAGSTMSVGEAGPNAAVQVMVTTSNGAPTGPASSVDYATTNGSATAGTDYTTTTGTLLIPLGTASGTTLTVNVPITQDALDEPDETFTFTISNPSNATLVPPTATTVTIIDDDAVPNVTLSLTGDPMAEAGGVATVTATLSAVSGQNVIVDLGFTGTATNPGDYTRSGTQIVIPAGSMTGSITLTAVPDADAEGAETVIVDIVGVTNGNEATPQQETATISEAGGMADLSITKSVVTPGPYMVGQNVTFDIVVTNNGPAQATGVVMTDVLPAGTTLVSATPSQGSCSGTTTVTCALGTLLSASATVVLTVQLTTPGSVANIATVQGQQVDPTPANTAAAPAFAVTAAGAVPTLSGWMLIALASLLAIIAVVRQGT